VKCGAKFPLPAKGISQLYFTGVVNSSVFITFPNEGKKNLKAIWLPPYLSHAKTGFYS
jgi:hypothetical protein